MSLSGSQDVTESRRDLFAPEYLSAVANNGYRGDFVQVMNRRDSEDERLFEVRRLWNHNIRRICKTRPIRALRGHPFMTSEIFLGF